MTRIRFFIDPSKTDEEIADAIRQIGGGLNQAEDLADDGRVADLEQSLSRHE